MTNNFITILPHKFSETEGKIKSKASKWCTEGFKSKKKKGNFDKGMTKLNILNMKNHFGT